MQHQNSTELTKADDKSSTACSSVFRHKISLIHLPSDPGRQVELQKMATGAAENHTKSDDFRHTCGLCMEPYGRGRSPKLLPCFHTFCLQCLTALAGNVTSTTTREENRGRTEEETSDTTADGETRKGDGHEETAVGVEEKLQEEEEEKEENEDGEQGKGEETRGDGDDDEGKGEKASDPGDVFLCPTCRAPVTVPKGGVAALQVSGTD